MTASSKLCRICKIIYVATIHITPGLSELKFNKSSTKATDLSDLRLYIYRVAAYICLHLASSRFVFAPSQPQSPAPQAIRRPEPPSRTCARPRLPGRWILRLQRSSAGQVRDAATSARGGNREDRGGRSFRRFAPDVLPGGSGLRASGLERTGSQDTRPQGGAQADIRSDAVYRGAAHPRRSARCSRVISIDRDRTGCVGPPPQHRTRPGAQKKTIVAATDLPPVAVSLYESLRTEVLQGTTRPEGLGAIVYHGMLDGLSMLMAVPRDSLSPRAHIVPAQNVCVDRGLVRLLANMILQTHSEVKHVY
jgi:hypothetical protein